MKYSKFICIFLSFVLIFCTLVGCKDKEPDESSSDTVSDISSTEAAAENDTDDPENTELRPEQGQQIKAEQLNHETGKALGIDVSKWQGRIDWPAVSRDGIEFAVIRIGYRDEKGVIRRDANADYNIQQAQKAGILIGVYFFSTAVTEAEAKEEAVWTAKAVSGYAVSYPVVYDCEGFSSESSRMYRLDSAKRTDNALAFIDEIERAGYEAMFYASKNDLESGVWDTARLESRCKIWLARYTSPTYPETKSPDYSGRYDMWQYTNRGIVSGINGNVDMIVSYFTRSKASAKDPSAKPSDAEAPPTEEDLLYTASGDMVTAKDAVNLREGAGTNYSIVGKLESGTFLKRISIGKNGWSRLEYNGRIVYAISSYLTDKVIEKEPEADIVNGMTFSPANDSVTTKDTVNLRRLPTTDSEIVATLKKGDFLKRTATGDKGWSRLDYNGQAVYAVTSYLTTELPEENKSSSQTGVTMSFSPAQGQVTAKEATNLRTAPSTENSEVVYTLKKGEYLERTGVSTHGWTRLDYNGQTVYAITSYLTE